MNEGKRRRSSRLRKLASDHTSDANRSGGRDAIDTSSKKDSKAKNSASKTSVPQSSMCTRKRCSDSESASSRDTKRRRKRTITPKPELSLTTGTDPISADRRRTRSFTRHLKVKTKTVTPSPTAPTTSKFTFTSTRKATHRCRGRPDETNDDDGSTTSIPAGFVSLYPSQKDVRASLNSFHTPTNLRSRTGRALKRRDMRQNCSNIRSRSIESINKGDSCHSCTPNSMTIDYIHKYGEEHWQLLHDRERPIISDPSTLRSSKQNIPGEPKSEMSMNANCNEGRVNYPFRSPTSRRSSSSSSSSVSKITPDDRNLRRRGSKASVATDFKWIQRTTNLQPHQSPENTKSMSIQPQLTPKMRSILVDWLIELSDHFSFGSSTLHLAVTLVDRVLASGKFLEHHNISTTEQRCAKSRSIAAKDTKHNSSIYDYFESDYSEADDENSYEDNEEDNKSRDTRCYIIPRDRFQLLGATCVWLACKIKESAPPKAREIAYVADHIYSIEQITRMERRVCNALNFSFFEAPTPHQFLFEYMRASLAGFTSNLREDNLPIGNNIRCKLDTTTASDTGILYATESVFRDMVHYLLELGRLPYGPTGRNPSLLAAAAVYLARVTLGIPRALINADHSTTSALSNTSQSEWILDSYYWTPTLKHYTGYTRKHLKETVMEIHEYHKAAESSALKAVFTKYKSKKYHRVALKTVVRVEDLGFS